LFYPESSRGRSFKTIGRGRALSQRRAPLVGTNTILGLAAVVVEPCTPWGRVRLHGETWQARSEVAVEPGARVRVRSVEGLTLHVEPEQAR